ncbi:MAG TPA: hypothetical protein VGQ85_05800 [Candidatus Limnocylindrales bacterium]|nr:hypothetical protein [Candidatus Limnocylindrales bacterium]
MHLPLFNRRDPWWDVEGSAARRDRRRHRLVAMAAFVASLAAVSGATYAWAIQLGLASFALNVG